MRAEFKRIGLEDELLTEQDYADFINDVADLDDDLALQSAIGEIARIRGMRETAAEAGLNEKSLYRALSPSGNPRLNTLVAVLNTLGLKLRVAPK